MAPSRRPARWPLIIRLFAFALCVSLVLIFLIFEGGMLHYRTGAEANIAFFLQISGSTMPMVPRLLRAIHHPKNVYALHLDAKIPDDQANALAARLTNEFGNVYFVEREPITYKGVTMLLNTIAAIDFLLEQNANWDYFINISGSDYPLVAPGRLRHLLSLEGILDRKLNFIQISPSKRFWQDMKKGRLRNIYFDMALSFNQSYHDHKLIPTWNKNPNADNLGIEFLQAEAWVTLHRSACEFTVHSPFARKLLLLLSTAQDPEEHFFPMLLWNRPEFNRTLARHALRGVYWFNNGQKSGQHPYIVDQRDGDGNWVFWHRIRNSPALFVRKMSTPNGPLMDLIDREKSGIHPNANPEAVWRSFQHAKNRLSCIADIDARREESNVMSCFGPPPT